MPTDSRQQLIAQNISPQLEAASRDGRTVLPLGTGSRSIRLSTSGPFQHIALAEFSKVERLEDQDFYITAQPGLLLKDLYEILTARKLKFPFLSSDSPGTVGGMVACGQLFDGESWFDICRWVLLLEVLLADGSVTRSGAVTYKSVAGYDLPRLFCGSFGTLGIILEVSLRLYPATARPYGKNLTPGKRRVPILSAASEASEPETAAGKISLQLKRALDPAGIFPIITGWNAALA